MTQMNTKPPVFEQSSESCSRTVASVIRTVVLLGVLVSFFLVAWVV
ncbi:hypothetical protein [Mycolicibacterium baixiangningiae]|nr:hypothetical protein [Mycolicibacterium baixiangningiae]